MAITEIYVDPSIAGDSGAGTSGDPYGDIEWAVENATFDTTNGTRVNIKAGTAEILAADIGVAIDDTGTTAAWVPAAAAPLVFQGYTTNAGDGGKGEISGNGSIGIFADSIPSHMHLVDLKMHNTGATQIVSLPAYSFMYRCELYDSSHSTPVLTGSDCQTISCYIHGLTGVSPLHLSQSSGIVAYCHIIADSGIGGTLINGQSAGGIHVMRCITEIHNTGNNVGIAVRDMGSIWNCSIYTTAGNTGSGINVTLNTNRHAGMIANNLIEGFSGTNGRGIRTLNTVASIAGNAVYNCETEYDLSPGTIELGWGSTTDSNEILSATPFANAATGDFAPIDTGAVKEGSLPAKFGDR